MATLPDFNLRALYDAIDQQRRARGCTWTTAASEINHFVIYGRPVALSTITSLKTNALAEGDGILQMLLWLGRTPESFVPGFPDADAERFRLPTPAEGQILRWDTRALHSALNSERQVRGMTWQAVGREIGGVSPAMLTNLARAGRISLPGAMRLVGWLGQPAKGFTRLLREGPAAFSSLYM